MEIVHKIRLNNDDLELAIELFLNANGVDTEGKKLNIDITAGRRGTGTYASVSLEEAVAVAPIDIKVVEEETDSDRQEKYDDETVDAVIQSTDPVPETTDEDDEATSLFS